MPCRLKEGERVTAEITLSIVRNGVRQGDVFVSDQGEEFSLNQVGEWLANNGK